MGQAVRFHPAGHGVEEVNSEHLGQSEGVVLLEQVLHGDGGGFSSVFDGVSSVEVGRVGGGVVSGRDMELDMVEFEICRN